MKCEWCNEEVDELFDVYLDGTNDFYSLDVCEKCAEDLCGDYYPPEQVDEMFE